MPRHSRIAPGGMVFHCLNRGVGRMTLFEKDNDYRAFEFIMEETLDTCPMRILSYCLMPNHWHLLLWPEKDGDLQKFLQRLSNTHVRAWQGYRKIVGTGHIYQGRYKSFPVQTDEHFLTAARYVERNALKANLCKKAEEWKWGSLWRRNHGTSKQKNILADWPIATPSNWNSIVNMPLSDEEEERLMRSNNRGVPFGGGDWFSETLTNLGLESSIRRPGRPKVT